MEDGYLKTKIKTKLFIITVVIILVNCLQALAKGTSERLASPNKEIGINIEVQEGTPVYSVWFNQHQIIRTSSLGFELESPFNGGFDFISKKNEKINRSWKPLYGEYDKINDKYNSLTINLKEINKPNRLLNIEFRAYNEGFAFRYVFPDQPDTNSWFIKKELTEFRFIDEAKGFPIYSGEATFSKISVPVNEIKPGAHYPLTINTGFGYASVLEAYAGELSPVEVRKNKRWRFDY